MVLGFIEREGLIGSCPKEKRENERLPLSSEEHSNLDLPDNLGLCPFSLPKRPTCLPLSASAPK